MKFASIQARSFPAEHTSFERSASLNTPFFILIFVVLLEMACCRCCNFNKPNLKDLYEESYDDDGSSSTLATKLEAVSGIQINQDDLCLGICFQCKLILEISFEFQKMVKKNEHLYSQQQQISVS